jgi:putative hydrolase of the HAD superfamily
MNTIRAVTFDVGGTLIEPWPSVGHVYSQVAAGFGLRCEPKLLNEGFAQAWRGRSSFNYTRAEWFEVVRQSFTSVGEVSPDLFAAIYERFSGERCWKIYDDVRPTLDTLKASGLRLAVISNWDERLIPLLDRLELTQYFEQIFVSSAVGAHKPAPVIFRKAAHHFNLPPNEILHIGDSETEDLRGATDAGFHARRIRRRGVLSVHDLTSLSEIPGDVLGQSLTRRDTGKEKTRRQVP